MSEETLPGLGKIKVRFLAMLEDRQFEIAHHALAAWESSDAEDVRTHLRAAQNTLHQIAGSAGSLGFTSLGQAARECEDAIIAHIEKADSSILSVPVEIIERIDTFVSMSQSLLSTNH